MRLIRPSCEILTQIECQTLFRRIEAAGRTCYKSEDKIGNDTAVKFVRMILGRGHESVIEHESMSVRFVVDRGVSHEIVRHRLCSFSQESTRYCDYGGGVTFVIPPWVRTDEGEVCGMDILERWKKYVHGATVQKWLLAMARAENSYTSLLEDNWTPQQARSVLPNSLKTEIVVTTNLREWRHILRLRTSKAAHPQMREVMMPLLQTLHCVLPVVFDDIIAES